ncbi:unnamed protein product, partial [Didymodactylos carnosus]
TYGRGAGRPFNACPSTESEQSGLLCYKPCEDGYNGVGPVCWEKCDNNMTPSGLFCISIVSSTGKCPWYDECGLFTRGCSICPENYTNLGCFCQRSFLRKTYGRGAGVPMICSSDYEQSGLLCYPYCLPNYSGEGPVCWALCPTTTQPILCLGVGCAKTKEDCTTTVLHMVQSVIGASLELLHLVVGLPFIDSMTEDLLLSAAKGDWLNVAKDISEIALALAEKLFPYLKRKFIDWDYSTIESATKNASLLLTVAAFNDTHSLDPFIKFFKLDSIINAFNFGLCDLV